ncbi:hypothetical protein [Nocardia concava]|uniref:hypothetical protein n=1 Tax=Nocardia concava TaxID=257281 RepID=UPI0002FDB3F2|nr:hypothetical protein [Nocardia concava]
MDLFEVEFLIAELLAPWPVEDYGLVELFGGWVVVLLEARATSTALGMLRGIAWLTVGELSCAAGLAADRVEALGVIPPPWVARLGCIRAREFTRVRSGDDEVLTGSFERAGEIHAFQVCLDHLDAGDVYRMLLLAGDELAVERQRLGKGVSGTVEHLPLPEFRHSIESALDVRARRDRVDLRRGVVRYSDPDDEPVPYVLAAMVLRAHLRAAEVVSQG